MSIQLRNLKGTRDFMAKEQRVRNEIIDKLKKVFQCYGYEPLETPILCYYDVLESKYAGGAEILKETYKLKDQGGREIGLRYDLTVPFAKYVGMNSDLKLPFKRYEIGKVFRNGPVKTGRMREFIQCDVDMVGVKSLMAEAELMTMAYEIYKQLGLEVYIAYNNRKLLSGLLSMTGVDKTLEGSVILTLDKLEKIGEKGVREELKDKDIRKEVVDELLLLLNMKDELLDKFRDNPPNELVKKGIEEIDELCAYLDAVGIKSIGRFSPCLARGLEIYTGTVFEVFLCDSVITSSIGSGGRYDNIIGGFLDKQSDYPAVGMSFGLDVIYTALELKGLRETRASVDVYIIPIGTKEEAFKLLYKLREIGISSDIEMNGKKVKKSLDSANKLNIPYVIVLGENELLSGKVKLRNMNSGEETEVDINKAAEIIKFKLGN